MRNARAPTNLIYFTDENEIVMVLRFTADALPSGSQYERLWFRSPRAPECCRVVCQQSVSLFISSDRELSPTNAELEFVIFTCRSEAVWPRDGARCCWGASTGDE